MQQGEKRVLGNSLLLVLLVVIVASSVIFVMYKKMNNIDSSYILKGNGRVEGREIAVATKFSGRIESVDIDEGDEVKKNQLLAVIDSKSIESNIKAEKAKIIEITQNISKIQSDIKGKTSDVNFYKKEVERSRKLISQKFSSQSELDKNINLYEVAKADLNALIAQKASLEASRESLKSSIEAEEIDLADRKIYAPSDGTVLYRLIEKGEVMAAGQKMFIMVNPDDLYMTIYMPSESAGKVKLGDDAVIKLDAYPNKVFPAKVTFIAENAEFTPKEVETQKERQKLVFRVKLTLKDNSLREVKTGMPGEGYIKIDGSRNWPSDLVR